MKKYLKFAFVAAVATIAGYGAYASQKTDAMSEFALANVEALANPEQPNTDDCVSDPTQNCLALHPTDPSKDKTEYNARW